MRGAFSSQAVFSGLLSAFVGIASSFAVIVHGLRAVGATQAEAASGLMALSVAMGLCGMLLSLRTRMPISVAWSTPGAALLATSANLEGGFPAAVGAFIVSGALIVLAGFWKPLGRWVAAIPSAIANAMLAGVVLGLCLAPVRAVAEEPLLGLVIVAVWAAVVKFRRVYAVPAAVIVALALIAATSPVTRDALGPLWPDPVLVVPSFEVSAIVGIGLPLFLVTMASQNIPGLAVLAANGYRPEAGPLFRTTGLFSMAAAPFGAHAVNLAAITAALCAGPEAGPDPTRRWWAGFAAGLGFVMFGLFAGAATAFISAAPPILIQAVAGLALLGVLGSSILGAVSDPDAREAAVITFLVTASGLGFFGISGAFWGLVAGGAMLAWTRWRRPVPSSAPAAAAAPGRSAGR